MKEQNEDGARKPYETPQLHRVELTPEEMFVAGCKTFASSAPAASPCSLNTCLDIGS